MADSYVVSTSDASMVDYPLWIQAASGDSAISQSASEYRDLIQQIWPSEGILGISDFKISQRAAGANFSVDIALGGAVVKGDSTPAQGSFLVKSTGTVNLTTPTAPGSGTRIHRVVAEILDKQAAGSSYGWQLHLIEDTGGGLPALPNSALDLGRVSISSGQASVQTANITNTALLASRWPGGAQNGFPVFRGKNTSMVSGLVDNIWNPIALQSEDVDNLNGHSTSSNTSRWVCPIPSYYTVTGMISLNTSTITRAARNIAAAVLKNGTLVPLTPGFNVNQNVISVYSMAMSKPITLWLDRGDYVELAGWHSDNTQTLSTYIADPAVYSSLEVLMVA